jgi:hypothetical protein
MSTPKISVSDPSKLIVRQARTRTAAEAPEGPSFGSVLKTGANVVLRGVETAAGIVGGPLVSGAIRGGSVALEGGGYGSGAGGGAGDDGSFDQVRPAGTSTGVQSTVSCYSGTGSAGEPPVHYAVERGQGASRHQQGRPAERPLLIDDATR